MVLLCNRLYLLTTTPICSQQCRMCSSASNQLTNQSPFSSHRALNWIQMNSGLWRSGARTSSAIASELNFLFSISNLIYTHKKNFQRVGLLNSDWTATATAVADNDDVNPKRNSASPRHSHNSRAPVATVITIHLLTRDALDQTTVAAAAKLL